MVLPIPQPSGARVIDKDFKSVGGSLYSRDHDSGIFDRVRNIEACRIATDAGEFAAKGGEVGTGGILCHAFPHGL